MAQEIWVFTLYLICGLPLALSPYLASLIYSLHQHRIQLLVILVSNSVICSPHRTHLYDHQTPTPQGASTPLQPPTLI